MAEFAVSFVTSRLVEVLDEIKGYKNVHREVERLQDELKRMHCFLKDADEKQEDDERVRNWISDIQNVAHDADDLIDMFLIRVELQKRRGFIMRKISSFKQWSYLCKVKKQLESIEFRLRDISSSRETYGIKNFEEGTSRTRERLRRLRRSNPRSEESNIIGLDEDTAILVAQLLGKEDRRWRAVSVVGMGGIGKTTLAKRAYNQGDVKSHFSCRAWMYVSQDYRIRDILQGILKQIAGTAENLEQLTDEELEEKLYTNLAGKKYLVVLDDMWSTEAWDSFVHAFPTRRDGSRLLITTRNKHVAHYVDDRTIPHELQCLDKDVAWELFCKKAFVDKADTICPPELEEIGRLILGKCGGLPLAIIVLGGILSRKKNWDEWQRVLSNVHSHFERNPNGVAAILALSYKDLPQHLKSCFLYIGLFPEDRLISTSKLIRLWIAEGFIKPLRGERIEDLAEDYLYELIDRNMVQTASMSVTDRVKECRIHDLLRDLAISKAKEENFLEIQGTINSSPSARSRRHAFFSNFDWYASLNHSSQHLRSLLFFRLDNQNCILRQLDFACQNFKLLRVMDIEDVRMSCLPNTVGELLHLKYLGLRNTKLVELPSTIGHLHGLQTLDVASNFYLKRIPNVIWKMEKLRHLYMVGKIHRGELSVDTLQHLQTLSDINVSNWVSNNLAKLTSLRKLGISGSFGSVSSHANEIFHSFAPLGHLETLYLHTHDVEFPSLNEISCLRCLTKLHLRGGIRNLPQTQQFPPNLSQLILNHSRLNQDSMEILEKLSRLLILRLKADSFSESQLAISANGFPQLKFLELNFLELLEELKLEEGALPRLRYFRISKCMRLKMLPEEIRFVTTLQDLDIKEMHSSFISRLQGVDVYKVQHIPTISLS